MVPVLVQDLEVKQTETIVRIDSCTFQLPDKQAGRELSYHTSLVQGRAILRDISRAFAPPLREFRMPVLFRCRMHGNIDEMAFNDIEVSTTNKHLLVLSKGTVLHMRDKYALHVHFDVPRMYAKNAEVIRVINQFPIKRFLMEQLQELGTITYRGGLDVFYKREVFSDEGLPSGRSDGYEAVGRCQHDRRLQVRHIQGSHRRDAPPQGR